MKGFIDFINESKSYTGWVKPTPKDLELEYKVEYSIKPLKAMTNDAFPTFKDFLDAANRAKVISVTPQIDRQIAYRSHTRSKSSLLNLIRTYRSYPKFRNEDTIEAIYKAFEDNTEMTMPIVLKMPDGSMRIMGGNTRMDIAAHMGVTPKVLLIEVPKK